MASFLKPTDRFAEKTSCIFPYSKRKTPTHSLLSRHACGRRGLDCRDAEVFKWNTPWGQLWAHRAPLFWKEIQLKDFVISSSAFVGAADPDFRIIATRQYLIRWRQEKVGRVFWQISTALDIYWLSIWVLGLLWAEYDVASPPWSLFFGDGKSRGYL